VGCEGRRYKKASSGGRTNGREEKSEDKTHREINGDVSRSSWNLRKMDHVVATFQLAQLKICHYPTWTFNLLLILSSLSSPSCSTLARGFSPQAQSLSPQNQGKGKSVPVLI
jgi:hypothetical protein